MAQKYAYEKTTVPTAKTMVEIDRELKKLNSKGEQWTKAGGVLELRWALPVTHEGETVLMPIRHRVSLNDKREQSVYRALYHLIKSKRTIIEYGISTAEEEFLPYVEMNLPGETAVTVAEKMLPHLRKGLPPPTINSLTPALPAAEVD